MVAAARGWVHGRDGRVVAMVKTARGDSVTVKARRPRAHGGRICAQRRVMMQRLRWWRCAVAVADAGCRRQPDVVVASRCWPHRHAGRVVAMVKTARGDSVTAGDATSQGTWDALVRGVPWWWRRGDGDNCGWRWRHPAGMTSQATWATHASPMPPIGACRPAMRRGVPWEVVAKLGRARFSRTIHAKKSLQETLCVGGTFFEVPVFGSSATASVAPPLRHIGAGCAVMRGMTRRRPGRCVGAERAKVARHGGLRSRRRQWRPSRRSAAATTLAARKTPGLPQCGEQLGRSKTAEGESNFGLPRG